MTKPSRDEEKVLLETSAVPPASAESGTSVGPGAAEAFREAWDEIERSEWAEVEESDGGDRNRDNETESGGNSAVETGDDRDGENEAGGGGDGVIDAETPGSGVTVDAGSNAASGRTGTNDVRTEAEGAVEAVVEVQGEGTYESSDPLGVGDFEELELIAPPQLLDWPHGWDENCVCLHPHYQDLKFADFYHEFQEHCDMNEAEMQEYHERMPEHTQLHLQYYTRLESSYLKLHNRCRSYVLRYERCSPNQLKTFVQARGLQDPYPGSGTTLKYFYIRDLEKADKDLTFRLMDLPPELRSGVYRELLLYPKHPGPFAAGTVHPAILSASRRIYDEAATLLYDENPFHIRFAVHQYGNGHIHKTSIVHNKQACICGDFRLPQGIDEYPDFLRKISRLHLHLSYAYGGTHPKISDGAYPLNHLLYTFASFLMDDHRLKHLHIQFDFPVDDNEEDWGYGSIIYPLRRLRNVKEVSFNGWAPPYIIHHVDRDLRSSEPAFNTMRYWRLLEKQASAYMNLFEHMSPDRCDCGECPLPEPYQTLANHLEIINEDKLECCLSSVLEENLIAHLHTLKKTLSKLDLADMQEAVQRIEKTRSELGKYEAVTDSGRLAEANLLWRGEIVDRHGRQDHDWSEDDMDHDEQHETIRSAAEDRKLLSRGQIAKVMEAWEPDAASQLSRATSPSNFDPDDTLPTSP